LAVARPGAARGPAGPPNVFTRGPTCTATPCSTADVRDRRLGRGAAPRWPPSSPRPAFEGRSARGGAATTQTRDFHRRHPRRWCASSTRDGGATMAIGTPADPVPGGGARSAASTVNQRRDVVAHAPDKILARWEARARASPASRAILEPYFERVERRIHVAPMDPRGDRQGQPACSRQGADAMGWKVIGKPAQPGALRRARTAARSAARPAPSRSALVKLHPARAGTTAPGVYADVRRRPHHAARQRRATGRWSAR